MTQTIQIKTLPTAQGDQSVGVLTLNRPNNLNSIDLPMVRVMLEQLRAWQADSNIVAVVLRGATPKAFSAGGDLHALYQSMLEHGQDQSPWTNDYGRDFFAQEYQLDHLIHTYKKPMIALGFGVLMGGGIGVFTGASHRVVAPKTRYAMPEIAIGLFPDVAGSWLLARLPAGIAHTLVMTGAHINGADAYYLGLADYLFDESTGAESIIKALCDAQWVGCPYAVTSRVLSTYHQPSLSKLGVLIPHYDRLRALGANTDFNTLCEQYARWAEPDQMGAERDPWLQRAGEQFLAGSPLSIYLSYELLRLNRHFSLAEAFQIDFNVAMHCLAHHDFKEGIRALIIDKDRDPQWTHSAPQAVSWDEIMRFLTPVHPKDVEHPLQHLADN